MKRRWGTIRKWIPALALAGGAGYLAAMYLVPWWFALPEELGGRAPAGVLFVDREDRPVRRLLDGDLRADEPASYGEFPEKLVLATLAAEDSRYFSHNGIDLLGIGRAVRDALFHREFVSGASTISQQTVKLYAPVRKRDFRTKFIEAFTARRLEMSLDKEAILTAYLNRLPYGNQFTGARAAARGYFGKPLGDLSLAEAALLAGLPNKPTKLNPWKNFDGARKRQLWILGRMKEEGYISEADFAAALVEGPKLVEGHARAFHAPHFTELVLEREPESVEMAKAGDARLRTTLDLSLQQSVEDIVAAELARLAQQAGEENDLQAAVVVIGNASGEVLALSGSRSFFASSAGQVNGAWRPRSAGSTLKPFTYALALERGATAATILADTPIEYITPTGAYQPVNFDRRFQGPVSIRHALANSLNVPAVKLLDEIGGPVRLHDCLVKDLHFTSLAPTATEYGLGLTLGNAEVRLLELANGYATLARLGEWKPVRFLLEEDRVEPDPEEGSVDLGAVRVFDPDAAWLIADILSDSRARALAFGLNSPLNLPFRVAAKTGTSTDFRDSWTVGYTPDFTVGVWVGRFNNRPLNRISGAMGAAPIFHQVMVRLHRGREARWYETPAGAVEATVDRISGKLPPEGMKSPETRVRKEWFVRGRLPVRAGAEEYDAEGRTLLPFVYSTWWRDPANPLKDRAWLEPVKESAPPPAFRIVSPLEGTVAFIDPDLPSSGTRFPLRVAGSGGEEIEWSSSSLSVESRNGQSWLVLVPGEHEVTALDRKSGRVAKSRLKVEAL
jgi:penicillin-binding protein 1C